MPTKIQLRRDTAADWTSNNPTLAAGEFGYESDTTKFKIGDGSTAWNSLAYKTGEGFKLVADDSATITVAEEGTLYVQGGTNITTSTDSAGVLTINSTAPGTITALNNQTANRLTTIGSTTTELDGEANLTFDGSTLAVTGAATVSTTLGVTGASTLDGITIADNKIDTNASNADLELGTNGTGTINLSTTDTFATSEMGVLLQGYGNAISTMQGVQTLYKEDDVPALTSTSDRRYIHGIMSDLKMDSSVNSSDSDNRFRNLLGGMGFDINGAELTNTSLSRGPRGIDANVTIVNSASDAATLGSGLALQSGVYLYLGGNSNGNVSNTKLCANNAYIELGVRSGLTATVSQAIAYQAEVYKDGLGGTETITDAYGFRCDTLEGTNKYAFFDATNSQSRFGLVQLANQSGDPSGITDVSHIYAKDDGGSSEVHVRDEAGNVTKISPHNDAGEWEFYSKNTKTGKTVRINMEKMIRKLEDITGETFIEKE